MAKVKELENGKPPAPAGPVVGADVMPRGGAPAGAIGVVLNPKVRLEQTRVVGPDGKARAIRLDQGKLYRLPIGTRWEIRKPAGVIEALMPKATPCNLDDLSPTKVRDHRLIVRGPMLARARAFLIEKIGERATAAADAAGEDVLIATHDRVAKTSGGKPLGLPGQMPADPVGVTDIPAAMREQLVAEFAPKPAPTSKEARVFALADEDPEPTPGASTFHDAAANEAARAAEEKAPRV